MHFLKKTIEQKHKKIQIVWLEFEALIYTFKKFSKNVNKILYHFNTAV